MQAYHRVQECYAVTWDFLARRDYRREFRQYKGGACEFVQNRVGFNGSSEVTRKLTQPNSEVGRAGATTHATKPNARCARQRWRYGMRASCDEDSGRRKLPFEF